MFPKYKRLKTTLVVGLCMQSSLAT
ncbi:hypothetical protein E2C01_056279 [Portunus trituberculatus]|uniref:Uncharacterized protein n=1 Tax=Portunus trituberculatus TaxID=210409 RepID=A0A5B7GX90_PORTR|nr:hypothetical protein [Portunus trituberculatus]